MKIGVHDKKTNFGNFQHLALPEHCVKPTLVMLHAFQEDSAVVNAPPISFADVEELKQKLPVSIAFI
jgi:hypothetical protein